MSFPAPTRAPAPAWPDGEPYEDVARGTLKSGKEAEIFLVERRFARSGSRLLAHKRYRPRYPSKDELRDRGFSNATGYRGDAMYRSGWFVGARDRRALAAGNKSRYGHDLASRMWPMQEWTTLHRAWAAGIAVPRPVEQTEEGLLMEFIGDDGGAAPTLVKARLDEVEAASAREQLVANLRGLTAAGLVHADLSAYNLLWWRGRLVLIDLPQAVEFTTNPDAFELLHRDLVNVDAWFARHRAPLDVEGLYAELVGLAWLG